ncbi:MAG TPA: DnaT-like ssDNA-binding protein [Microvirga sp.]|jgi:hypothetical protein|nr:DnaT-like ssDNA-binding protein [Microvirga sp.]
MTQWDPTLPGKAKEAIRKASQAEQESALKAATAFIDGLPFKGERASPTQTLSWPRIGVLRDDGAPITGVPPEIKEATSLVAGFILADVPFGPPAVAWIFKIIDHLLEGGAEFIDSHVGWRRRTH